MSKAQDLPIVGVTLGDVAGIGPEVVLKAVRQPVVQRQCRPLVIGDGHVFTDPRFAALAPHVEAVTRVTDGTFPPEGVTLLDLHNLDPAQVTVGEICPAAGRAAVEYVVAAVDLTLDGEISAVATAPLNKAAMQRAGHAYLGHTELLMERTKTQACTTMLATPGLRVTHVTRHVPFCEIPALITRDRVLETIVVTHEGMRDLGFDVPCLAVAGLNPHNGEEGLLGREEIDVIAPAVGAAQARAIDACGPIPADSVFFQALAGDYDAVVTMYHDQGHIAVKTHNFAESITITLGLPIVRTSADHGTAFDIAGQGIADARSMTAAILEAANIARRRERRTQHAGASA